MVRLPCSCQFKYKPYSFSNRVAKTILPRTSFRVEIRMEGYTNIQYFVVEGSYDKTNENASNNVYYSNKNIHTYLLMSKYTKININVKSRLML